MALFLQFISEQWMLVSALLAAIFMLSWHESRQSGRTVSPQQVSSLINDRNALVLDLRETKDFRAGHIVGAINMPQRQFAERCGELDKYRDRPLILTCAIGQNASAAGKQLRKRGFSDFYRLSGGISEWKNQQLPLVKN